MVRINFENKLLEGISSGRLVARCNVHSNYKGLRKPRGECGTCWAIWAKRKSLGIRESRKRRIV